MCSAKIIGIHGGREQIEQAQNAPLPRSLVKLRDAMKQKSTTLLRRLFETADDMLFAMADKSGSASDHSSYFDAMRELRLKKKVIALEVIRGVIQSFNEIGRYKCSMTFGSKEAKSFDDLGLVENDELELNVAVEAMINRIRSRNINTLEELRLRIESLVTPVCITPEQMPMSPEILCSSFIEGCSDLELDIRAKLVLLKLFEKSFLTDVCKVYAEANALLLQMGILPNLKRSQTLPERKAAHENGIAAALRGHATANSAPMVQPLSGGPQSHVEGLFQDLRRLLRESGFYADAANTPSGAPASSDSGASATAVPVYSKQQLVSSLTDLQNASNVVTFGAPAGVHIDFRSLLEPVLSKNADKKNYAEADIDTINLVSMLFEFILEDRQLQATMKALIARLQIPILKVALLDRSFFNKGGHPARKLLNEMAAAAIGWNEAPQGKPDRLKDKIEELVYKVLDHFDNNLDLFTELLADFQNFSETEARRGRLVEQRIRDAEEGKAANESARIFVQNVINEQLKGKVVCKPVIEILRDAWSSVMVLHYLKHGEQSDFIKADMDVVRDLIWTVCPDPQDGGRPRLLTLIPSVIKRIRAGLSDVSYDEFRLTELLGKLEKAHIQSMQILQEQQELLRQQQDTAVSELARETLELEQEFNAMLQQGEALATPTVQPLVERIRAGEREEIILIQQEQIEAVDVEMDENDPFLRQVDNLVVGCWFEFMSEGKPERCKLAALIRSVGKYLFVNRSGIKVAEKTRLGLAAEMRSGAVQVLNDGLLFDRALESIISNLRVKSPDRPSV